MSSLSLPTEGESFLFGRVRTFSLSLSFSRLFLRNPFTDGSTNGGTWHGKRLLTPGVLHAFFRIFTYLLTSCYTSDAVRNDFFLVGPVRMSGDNELRGNFAVFCNVAPVNKGSGLFLLDSIQIGIQSRKVFLFLRIFFFFLSNGRIYFALFYSAMGYKLRFD